MAEIKTLPELQAQLDRLDVGDQLDLSSDEYEYLFGINDVAIGRLEHFAEGHGCTAFHTGYGVAFRRLPRRVGEPAK